ncbi:titin-like isoform X2 [Varroa destructor]|nr:titin-like isoform X2 [Varroa destructor]
MTKLESDIWMSIPSNEFNTFWVPCTWFINLLREAKMDCRVTDGYGVKLIMEEFNEFRAKCGLLWSYDWISIPLVYTQVVTLATYAFFAAALFGRQYVQSKDPIIAKELHFDYYVPAFTVVQYFLYMGLLKVAEQLINPFGDDDEDFELNWIIDRHIKVCYLGVDTLCGPPPPLVKDSYFSKMDYKLPYTAASVAYKKKTYRGSAAWMHVPQKEQSMVVPEISEEEDEAQTSSEEVQQKSSTWNLLKGHRHSLAVNKDPASHMEAGDSNLHIYFKAPTPGGSEQQINEETFGTLPQDPNHLQLPADDGTISQTSSSLKAASPVTPATRSKKIGIFTKKGVKVQAWKGPLADYEFPHKPPKKKGQPPKVTFLDERGLRIPRRLSTPVLHMTSSSQPELAKLAVSKDKLKERLSLANAALRKAELPQYTLQSMLLDRKALATTESLDLPMEIRPDAWLHHRSLPNIMVDSHPEFMTSTDVVIDVEPPSRESESPESEYVMKFLKDGNSDRGKMVLVPVNRAGSVESLMTPKRYPLIRKRSTSLDSYTPPPSPEAPVVTISLKPQSDVTVEADIVPRKQKTPSPPPPPPPPKEQSVPPAPPLPPKPLPARQEAVQKPKEELETGARSKMSKFRKGATTKDPNSPKSTVSHPQKKGGPSHFRRGQPIPGLIKPPPLPFCAEMPKLRPVQLPEEKEEDKSSEDKASESELSILSPQTEHLLRPSQLRRISRSFDPKTKKKKES